MRLLRAGSEQADVGLSSSELRLVGDALSEVCDGLDVLEFVARLGVSRGEARALLDRIGAVIDQGQGTSAQER
ncbi:hypothetical protein [Bradyrhizobium sp.]|uniref:hypothetical protein n=1 Tax=Bradyrhizobium sp. TaxID=376 RepID=UPI001EB9B605|nr:hypothetical protein [Bradyrhizobium sp.]MBV9978885.1 hypothetical protein [Bradyrhizobium sp.]